MRKEGGPSASADEHPSTLDATAKPTRPDAPTATARVPSQHALAPGELLAGRYRVVRLIARGGFGAVYEVDDCLLRERVALKALLPDVASNPQAFERWRREVQLARKVTHRNICRVFEVGVHDGTAFLTMELLQGETLHQRIQRAGPLDLPAARALTEQLVAGLAAAHGAGVIHRDFKSANIILVEDPARPELRAVITDFGIALPFSDDAPRATAPDACAGTPGFMAPEQVAGRKTGAAVDIYALGVVLYHLLTGHLPSEASAGPDARDAPWVRAQRPDLDLAWERVIRRCLEPDPAQRFARVEEVSRALGLRPTAPPRRRRAARIAVAAALALTAAGLWAGRLATRSRSTAPPPLQSAIDARARPSPGPSLAPPSDPGSLVRNGLDLFFRGNVAPARHMLSEGQRQARAAGDRETEAFALAVAAYVAKEAGEIREASTLFEQSWRTLPEGAVAAGTLTFWAELRLASDDLAGARGLAKQALALTEGHSVPTALVWMVQAEIALEERKPREAETHARSAAEALTGLLLHHEVQSRTILARALLAQGKRDEARKQVKQARARPGEMVSFRLRLEMVAAQLEPPATARAQLEVIAASARSAGLFELALEARRALADTLDQIGDRETARTVRAQVVKDARTAGYDLLARKASAGGPRLDRSAP